MPRLATWCLGWLLLTAGCADGVAPYTWAVPTGFPEPATPEDNPMSAAKVELGRFLFYDKRLSGNGTQACASCHRQEKAFTDGRTTALGSTGESHRRNALSLANVAYAASLTWANPVLPGLEAQTLVPLFGEQPVELGLAGQEEVLLQRLARGLPLPRPLRRRVPRREAARLPGLHRRRPSAAFERTLFSGNSPYDRYTYRDELDALSLSAKRGMRSSSASASSASTATGVRLQRLGEDEGHRLPRDHLPQHGPLQRGRPGRLSAADQGLREFTGKPEDMGRFRAPTLRNIAVTAPYMHDGSIATLSEVLDHYAAGGRARGQGLGASPYQSELIRGFTLTPQEKEDVLAFLESLTDTEFLTDPRFSDPFASAP